MRPARKARRRPNVRRPESSEAFVGSPQAPPCHRLSGGSWPAAPMARHEVTFRMAGLIRRAAATPMQTRAALLVMSTKFGRIFFSQTAVPSPINSHRRLWVESSQFSGSADIDTVASIFLRSLPP
jgi:hypothetical protein